MQQHIFLWLTVATINRKNTDLMCDVWSNLSRIPPTFDNNIFVLIAV